MYYTQRRYDERRRRKKPAAHTHTPSLPTVVCVCVWHTHTALLLLFLSSLHLLVKLKPKRKRAHRSASKQASPLLCSDGDGFLYHRNRMSRYHIVFETYDFRHIALYAFHGSHWPRQYAVLLHIFNWTRAILWINIILNKSLYVSFVFWSPALLLSLSLSWFFYFAVCHDSLSLSLSKVYYVVAAGSVQGIRSHRWKFLFDISFLVFMIRRNANRTVRNYIVQCISHSSQTIQ